jgi:hypothetical protein
MNEYLEGKA